MGIDLYFSVFGLVLNVFSCFYFILDNSGVEVCFEVVFVEVRKVIVNYCF